MSKIAVINHKGFTLIEVLVASGILAFCLCGLLAAYVSLFFLSDLARDTTLATNAIQQEMEKVKNINFDSLSVLNDTKFNLNGFSSSGAKGVIYVSSTSYDDLKKVRIVASFKSRGRVIGEDKDLDGTLDNGEDTNPNNNRLDSPLEIVTFIAK
jgi:prepilin-type N-terminal cleavage/methylation domain-containing protein